MVEILRPQKARAQDDNGRMRPKREEGLEKREAWWKSGTAWVVGIAAGTVVAHVVTGGRYGFDRDELMALEDARHLAWGYVQYPPMVPFFGRIALWLFGTSLTGFRFFAALVQAIALVLTGLMAKELGGGKWAQIVAALAGVPFCLGGGALMQYISFDYVCWVLVAYGMVRILGSGVASGEVGWWWIWVGAGIGLGMLAKYTMAFLVAGVVAGVLLTSARQHLKSVWLWIGVLTAVAISLPNLWWQWQRNFVSLEFLQFVHARDVRTGATDWFLPGQLELTLLAFPLAMAGLWRCFAKGARDRQWRVLGWMYVVPLILFLVMRGRHFYLAPAYPMLYAAGAVWMERGWQAEGVESSKSKVKAREPNNWRMRRALAAALVVDVIFAALVALPIAPVNSRWWKLANKVDPVFAEEIGWEEFVAGVARVRDGLPVEERARLGILAGNYGEVGALNLYGEKLGLPRAISGVNSSWERGYGNPAPGTVIVVGYPRELLERYFASCVVAGQTKNRYGVANEEVTEHPDIFVCRGLRGNWDGFWKVLRKFA